VGPCKISFWNSSRAEVFPEDDSLFDMTPPKPDPRPALSFTQEQLGLLQTLIKAMPKG